MREPALSIHHVTPRFYPDVGGLEDSVRRSCAGLVQRGHRVTVHTSAVDVSGRALPPRDSIDGIAVRRYVPEVQRGYFRTWFRPDLSGAELIHLHGYAVRTNDRVVRAYGGRPIVFSLHHGVRMPHTSRTTRVLRRGYDTFVGLPTLHRVRRILVPSQGDRTWLIGHHIPPDRIRILPTPLSEEAFHPGDRAWALERTRGLPFVLYLGRLHQEKGVDDLLETIPSLPEKVRLVYAGPDAGRLERLQRRAESLGIADRVMFLGAVAEEQKRSLLATCTALALPSLFEAQGLAVLEAWAQGRPVVASRVGALSEWIISGETGILIPYGDIPSLAAALRDLLENPERADEMGRRGLATAEQFQLDRLGPALEAIYREVTSDSSTRR